MRCDHWCNILGPPLPLRVRGSSRTRVAFCSTGMIVDILDRDDSRQILGIRFARFAKPITTRSEPGEPATTIDDANVQIAEPYHLVTGLELRDADSFTHQRLADENALALPYDLSRAAHSADLMIRVIPRVLDPHWHRSRRSRIELRRKPLPHPLVRPLLIVMSPESIEPPLLFGRIHRRRLRSLLLQRAMHALVPAVLLWRSRTDEMRLYPELEPPSRQSGQTARSARPERRSVIAADRN